MRPGSPSRFPLPRPFPPLRETCSTRPMALTIPVNIVACPIPIMYPGPLRAAPPASSVAPRGAVEHDAHGRWPRRERAAHRELRVVPQGSRPAHGDGVESRAQPVHVLARRLTRHPARAPVRVRDPAVDRGRELEGDERSLGL